jgi:FkbM family methyltransferase
MVRTMVGAIVVDLIFSEGNNPRAYSKWQLIVYCAKLLTLRGLSRIRVNRQRHEFEIQHLSAFNLKFSFPDVAWFSFLFNEIFIKQDYFFLSDRTDPLIIDCGSNMGLSILYFKRRYPKARIIGFEPNLATFEMLQKNVAANALSDVVLHNCAVADREGEAELFCEPNATGSLVPSLRKERSQQNVESKKVRTVLLSDYLSSEVDFLKVDIEGMEMAVIEDLARKDKLSQVREMAIEYHHHIPAGNDALSRLLTILENNGFGYRLGASIGWPIEDNRNTQDILVRAYRK